MHLSKNQRTGLIVGGALVAGGLTTLIARQVMAATTPPSVSPSGPPVLPPEPKPVPTPQVQVNFAPVTTLTPGSTYLIAAPVPSQFTTSAALLAALQAAGWTNANVNYFGPGGDPATNWPVEMPFPADTTTMPTMYVAGGVYSGTAGPVPAGAVAYLLTSPVSIPGTVTTVPYKGKNILVTTTGLLWFGNASCPGKNLMTLLPNSTGLAIGSSQAEVTSKLATWLDTNCP